MRNFRVYVQDVNINNHVAQTKSVTIPTHWAVNARHALATTLETKLMSALAQAQSERVLRGQNA